MAIRQTAAVAAIIWAACPAFAVAQSNQSQSADQSPAQDGVEVIVVTANKRETRSLDVPTSLVAVSGDRLDRLNLSTATDLQFVAPGVGLGDANTPRGAGLRIRGIGTNVFADGIEQSVGTVIDGVPLARAGQGLTELSDVERVEVLRGPQGMLFGRNASAGLINIVTRRPTEELTVLGNISFASHNEVKAGVSIAGSLSEGVRGRITGFSNSREGIVDNLGTGKDLNDHNEYGFRGALEFTPSDNLTIMLRADQSKRETACCIWTVRSFATAAQNPAGATLLSTYAGSQVVASQGPENRLVNQNGAPFNQGESGGVSAEVNYRLGDYTLTSVSAWRTWDQFDGLDSDQTNLNILDTNFGSNELEQVSQELRLTSPGDSNFSYVVGLFYFKSTNDNFSRQVGRFTAQLGALQGANINLPLGGGLVLPASANFGRDVTTTIGSRDYAAFGEATFKLGENVKLIAGGRFTDTEVYMDYVRAGTPGSNAYNFILGAQFSNLTLPRVTVSEDNVSWRLGVQYEPTPDANFYATVSRGYKGPGLYNGLDTALPSSVQISDAEQLRDYLKVNAEIPTAFEIGYKSTFWEGRGFASVAVYHSDFKDFQAQVVETPPGQAIGSFAIRNAGNLRTQGLEAEVQVRPSTGLTLGFGFAYNDAVYESFTCASRPRGVAPGANPACTTIGANVTSTFDASGLRATNAPKYTANLDARYEWGIGEAGSWKAFVQGNAFWRDDVIFGLVPEGVTNPYIQPAYGLVNGSVGITAADGQFTIRLYAKNLLDQNFVTGIFDTPFDGVGGRAQWVSADAERTVGI
ncbi:MAG: TonB-dependent receptor, partial [Aquidulcibacter sp.]|uniref:TonB-dependent receptor n=1 Tax=Aquidulcibacter sp. TaxID=2052990 RepID=UPI0022C2FEE7